MCRLSQRAGPVFSDKGFCFTTSFISFFVTTDPLWTIGALSTIEINQLMRGLVAKSVTSLYAPFMFSWSRILIELFAFPSEMDQQRHFIAGYNECAREVQLYLLRSTEVSPQAKAQMLSHISATPQEITPGPTMVNQTKPNEISFTATKPSFSPIMSAYPSPPASPVYMQTSTETMSKELRNALYLENRASSSQDTFDQKKQISVSNPNQRLWRPWQSA